ncbi:MAG: type II secretion system F family protein [Deltaproteobacteria bacterium]|nr:type II secretion system F family protein [Deltaproteobacteria bacterium]
MTIITVNIPVLVSITAFLAIVLLFAGLFQYFRQKAKERDLLEKVRAGGDNRDVLNKEESSFKTPISNFLSLLGKHLVPEDSADYTRTRSKFLRAGLRRANVVTIFWGIKLLLTFSFPICFLLAGITFLKPIDANTNLFICLLLAFSGFYLPDIWLLMRTSRRKNKILEGLPDALDLMVVCVETGMGLDATINRVAEEIGLGHKILSDELKLMNLEIRAGKSREDALRDLATRTGLEDVNSLVTLLIQTDRFGTSVAQALRVYSDSVRTKRYQRAEEIAAKLPVKLMLPLILLIFPSLFVVILGPAAVRVYRMFLQ